MKRIGILGGSFNPPQIGHVALARYALDQKRVDEVCVMPCADHPYGKDLAPFANRLAMCQLAFHGIPHVVVSDLEAHLPAPSYTVQTLRHLIKTVRGEPVEPPSGPSTSSGRTGIQFFLIVGSDIATDVSNWKDGSEIQNLASLIVVPRGPQSPIADTSSTEVRRRIHDGESIADLVPTPVAQYIQAHPLYR